MKEINRILSSVLLFVVGTGLSLITGNFIITTVSCFLLGLVLNRGGKQRTQKTVVSKTTRPQLSHYARNSRFREPSVARRCSSCGAIAEPDINYCEECGSLMEAPTTPAGEANIRRYSPSVIGSSLERLRNLNEKTYAEFVQHLVMVDESDKYWSIGVRSSKWYTCEYGDWVVGQPTSMMRIMRKSDAISGKRPTAKVAPATMRTSVRNICDFCGAVLASSDDFCINCGRRLAPRPRQ